MEKYVCIIALACLLPFHLCQACVDKTFDGDGGSPWLDSNGYGCGWYGEEEEKDCSDDYTGLNGLTPNEACCACGGGQEEESRPEYLVVVEQMDDPNHGIFDEGFSSSHDALDQYEHWTWGNNYRMAVYDQECNPIKENCYREGGDCDKLDHWCYDKEGIDPAQVRSQKMWAALVTLAIIGAVIMVPCCCLCACGYCIFKLFCQPVHVTQPTFGQAPGPAMPSQALMGTIEPSAPPMDNSPGQAMMAPDMPLPPMRETWAVGLCEPNAACCLACCGCGCFPLYSMMRDVAPFDFFGFFTITKEAACIIAVLWGLGVFFGGQASLIFVAFHILLAFAIKRRMGVKEDDLKTLLKAFFCPACMVGQLATTAATLAARELGDLFVPVENADSNADYKTALLV